jgi:uncharacterized protein
MKIGIDVDEVLCELLDGFLKFYNEKYGRKFAREDFLDYHFEKLNGGTQEDVDKLLEEYGYPSDIDVVTGAVESLKNLSGYHELIVLTARYPKFKEKTEEFLNKNFGDIFSDVLYTGEIYLKHGTTKADLCCEKNIDVMIDDNKTFACEIAEKGVHVLLLNKPWNQGVEHENITRVDDWDECLKIICKMEEEE